MTVTAAGASFAGAGAGVGGTHAAGPAPRLTRSPRRSGCEPVTLDDDDRPAYHAAASVASNFLVTLEAWAEELLPRRPRRGSSRSSAPPSRAGPPGPRACADRPDRPRGLATVARQRAAVAERTPERLALWDALAAATEVLAARARSRMPPPAGAVR